MGVWIELLGVWIILLKTSGWCVVKRLDYVVGMFGWLLFSVWTMVGV